MLIFDHLGPPEKNKIATPEILCEKSGLSRKETGVAQEAEGWQRKAGEQKVGV